ncbi:MFS transporter [Kribbella sp. NPDC058245]|uniref:MFS transporter n=1 Tax=Kribbella sp. NPDC058245 TaxID=3346399 RepID=UPI0036F193EA
MTLLATRPVAPPRPHLSRMHVPAIAGCYFVASFAALGLPPYLTEILPSLGDESGRWAGLLYVVPTVFSAIGAPFWGRLADRYGRKRLLLRAQLGLSIAFLAAGLANSLPAFTLALVLQGFLGGTFAASNGYLAAALTGDKLSKALTLMQGSARAALVVAPILVGSLSPWVSPHRQYLIMAVLPLAAAVLLVLLPEPDHPVVELHEVVSTEPPPPLRTLRLLYVFEFAFVFATIISFPYLIALIERRMPNTSGAVAGVLFALPHLCYLVFASGVHQRFRTHSRSGLAAGFAFVALGLAAHAVVRTLPGFVVARLILGIGMTLGLVCLSILAADAARGRAPGRMFGTVEFFSKAGAVAAGAVAAVSNSLFGAAAPVLIGTCAALVTAVSAVLLTRPRMTSESPMSVMQSLPPAATALPRADHVVAHTLLNCLLREVSAPEHQSAVDDGWLLLRLPRAGVLLRVELRRTALVGAHRFTGPVFQEHGAFWAELTWRELADLVRRELALRSGFENEEFLPQIESSHEGVTRALTRTRPAGADRFLESEQAMLFGHRFHPAPKARTEDRDDWAAYAPESRAAFQLRHLAVRADLLAEESLDPEITALLDNLAEVPAGYRLLPAHPWQFAMIQDNPLFQAAVERGDVIDLGVGGVPFTPTSSVRTLAGPDAFLKFSLNIRITNCLRKNAAYEMTGAVALTRLLAPVLADLAARFPGAAVLREPAFRTLALPAADGAADLAVYEGFGLIVRTGLNDVLRPGVTPLMAAAVADEYATSSAHISLLLEDADDAEILSWWAAYLRLLVPPVLAAYLDHGVVLEPHLQNVLIGVDANNQPVQVLFRDLEGTKLVDELHTETLAGLPADVAGPMTYDAQRGWDRVVYCLLVNHVSDLLGAVADLSPELEGRLWAEVRTAMEEYADENGCPPLLAALLAGVPLPAKTNMLTRWGRLPDRSAGYVRLPSPIAEAVLAATTEPVAR